MKKYLIALMFLIPNSSQSFEQVYIPSIDVLFIMDNSPSMKGAVDRSTRNFPMNAGFFINQLSEVKFLSYHIGVTTSSTADTAFFYEMR